MTWQGNSGHHCAMVFSLIELLPSQRSLAAVAYPLTALMDKSVRNFVLQP